MIISRSIHVAANDAFFLFNGWIVFCRVCVPRLHHFSADGHLGCFHVLVVVTSVAMSTGVHVSFWIIVLSEYMSRSWVAGSYGSFFSFSRTLHIVFHNDYTFPSKEHKDSNFSTFWPTLLICCLFDNSHPNRREVILICSSIMISWASQVAQQESYSNAGDLSLIPGWKRSPEEGMATHSNILAWRIPMDRGAWRAIVYGVAKSWTRLSDQAQHSTTHD